jgi:hypothetical protein
VIFKQSRRGLLLPLWYLFASLYVVAVLARPVYGFRSAARVSSARAQKGVTSSAFIHRQGNVQRFGVDSAFVLPLEAQRRGRNSRREAMAGAGGASMISSMFRWRKVSNIEVRQLVCIILFLHLHTWCKACCHIRLMIP